MAARIRRNTSSRRGPPEEILFVASEKSLLGDAFISGVRTFHELALQKIEGPSELPGALNLSNLRRGCPFVGGGEVS